ncbi:MAG TPA: ribosome small subunit-dependent GTPase A [Gemmatimonadales bacterium]|nr:ribosome small subunit-dependent GTPase A [Gemmatimonadales bacterium]
MTAERRTAVVLARTGSSYRVHTGEREVTAVLKGRLKLDPEQRIVAGDVVELEFQPDGGAVIAALRPRRSLLARREVGSRRAQPIAANLDQVVVVAAARDPEPNPRQLDRFLVIAEANGLPAALVVNKVDLDRAPVATLERRYRPAGYQVLATSVRTEEGLAALRDLLRGRATVFTGPSGVGKSSLLNALHPGLGLRTAAISAKWRQGRHTTTAAQLVPLNGGYVVDTPGMREVGAWGLDPNALGACFPEFRRYLDRCRFADCRHLAEPDCAVRRAAEAGEVDPDRLASYRRIYEEINLPAWSSGRRRGS